MFRNSNKIPVGGDRAGPLKNMKFLKLKKNNMLKRAIKAVPESVLRRYLAMLLTVVTFITAIPISNLMTAKAVDEYNYSLTVTIDLNGGDSDGIFYRSNVDRDGCGYNGGQWVQKLGIGKTFLDKTGTPHTIIDRGADTPCEGTFTVRADAVGITPHVVISTPTRDGYTFEGWDTNTDTKEYDGDTAFEVGAYAPDNITITAKWSRNEPDTASMTVSWDSGVSYVGADGYSSDYDFTFNGQSHDFPYNSTLQTNVHLKDGYELRGFQEGDYIWDNADGKDWWINADYPNVRFATWSMARSRNIRVLTKTTLSFEYDNGFTNSSHTETVSTDNSYKDYPKFNENYELDYAEDLDTGDKWYSYDGRDSKGSYMSWTASRPRRIKYHSKLIESAKKTLNLDQNGATTKGTERVDVYHDMKISDVTIPKKEYTATFWDIDGTPKKVCSDIVNKFKFLGYKNDTQYVWEADTTGYADYFGDTEIISGSSIDTVDTFNGEYGKSYYFDLNSISESASIAKMTTGNGTANNWMRFSIRNTPNQKIRVSMRVINGGVIQTEDGKRVIQYSFDLSSEEEMNIFVGGTIEIYFSKKTSGNAELYVEFPQRKEITTGYWYDENGKGLINYPLTSNHTIKAVWSGDDITYPEAPAKEGYEFVGWRTEDAELMTAEWGNKDSDYLDCKENFNGDVAAWFKASREGNAENDWAVNYYLVPDSYYLNDDVIHFQYYYVDYAGDETSLSKDTKFIACYDEIPKVTLKTSAGKGISKTYIDGTECTSGREVYENTTHTIKADVKKGYKFDAWYSGGKVYSIIQNTRVTVGNTDLSLIAKANANNYKISYNLDDGTHGTSHPDSAEYDNTVTISNPTKTGYTFTGWTITGYDKETSGHTDSTWTGETRTDYRNLTAADGATVTFTAAWTKNVPKTANLQTTGDVGIKTTSHAAKTVVNIGNSVQVSAVLKTGYAFAGWYNGDTKISDNLNFTYTMPNTDTVLTAKTNPVIYSITYNLNGGALNGKTNPISYTVETNTFTLNNPVKPGYTFAGWCESNDVSYVYNRSDVNKGSDTDLIAKFEPSYYASLDYGAVFDPVYYLNKYADLKDAYGDNEDKAFNHFVNYGMSEGRQGSAQLNVYAYKAKYSDLSDAFGNNLPKYYIHYILAGKSEGRTTPQQTITIYKGSIGNRSYSAEWTANTDTKYTVEYYQMNLDGKTYTKHESKTFTGTTDTKVADIDKLKVNYTGFTYERAENADAVINGDGSTVVKLYYNRNKYILDINSWIDSTKYDCLCYWTKDTDGNATQYIAAKAKVIINGTVYADGVTDYYNAGVYYGSDIQIIVTPETGHTIVDDTSVDYLYKVNNNVATINVTMPAENKEIAPVLFTDNVNVTVNHYQMNLDGKTYTLKDADKLTGKSNNWITPETRSYEGFTSPNKQTVKVKADGTTVVNYYYSRNQYYLNLNGYLKQRSTESFADLTETVKDINGKDVKYTFATATIKINGEVISTDVVDFNKKVYYGSTYEIITTAKTGYTVIDNTGTLKGTVTNDTVVMPHVSINQYIIRFEPNKPSKADAGENLTAATQAVYYNRQRALNANTFKFTGYTFTEWNTKADGTGTAYTDKQAIENLSSADGTVITLYAQWKIHTHTITVNVKYENADGTFTDYKQWKKETLEYNTSYNYTVYKDDVVYQNLSTSGTMKDTDITVNLTALRKTYNQKLTVYYEQPDGTFDTGTVVINKAYRYGQTVSWSRNADVRYKAGNISWQVAGTNAKKLNIYRQQYKITVNGADKHITTTGSGTYRYGYELWITAEVETGYHFINWNMDSSLTDSSMKIEVTGDKTYTAYAEANKYLITYNLNKPARASSTPKLNVQNTWEYEYNSKILYMPTAILTGWTFEGWYTEADGGTEVKIGDIYKWIGDITLYAHWTENTYTIHYESDGGTAINDINVKYEDPVKLAAVPYRPGYNFSYWNTKLDGSGHSYEGSETVRHLATSGTVTLYAVWSKKAMAQIGAAVNMTEKNGYVFGHITDDSVSIRTYVIDENGNISVK